MAGWIKLHRSLLSWEWFKSSETVHLFTYCLLSASYEDSRKLGVELKRGQFLTTLPEMVVATGITEKKIKIRLERLKKSGAISVHSTNRYRVITVLNYEKYQDDGNSGLSIDLQSFTCPFSEPSNEAGKRQAEGEQRAGKNNNIDNLLSDNYTDKNITESSEPSESQPSDDNKNGQAFIRNIRNKEIIVVKNTLERAGDFHKEVFKFSDKYPSKILNDFFEYWSEPNKSKSKMRFELEKTWEIRRRLAKWAANDKTFNPYNTTSNEKPTVYNSPV